LTRGNLEHLRSRERGTEERINTCRTPYHSGDCALRSAVSPAEACANALRVFATEKAIAGGNKFGSSCQRGKRRRTLAGTGKPKATELRKN